MAQCLERILVYAQAADDFGFDQNRHGQYRILFVTGVVKGAVNVF
jgi:hypothetical protein